MAFECYRVVVPENARLAGYTVAGRRVQIAPGEYVVHRMRPKVPLRGIAEALRFLGADERGEDLHVPVRTDPAFEHALQRVAGAPPEQEVCTSARGISPAAKAVDRESCVSHRESEPARSGGKDRLAA